VPGGIHVVNKVLEEMEGSRVMTEFTDDSHPPQFHQFWVGLQALRNKAITVREAILLQKEELEGIRAVCVESKTKLTHVGEWLGSLMVQLECTLERQGSPTQTYIDDVGSASRLPLCTGEGEAKSPQ